VYVSYYVPVPVPVPVFPAYGPAGSFNNSYPTYINGRALYSGYYAAGAIFPAYETVGSFNNSYPTYVNGRVVYSGYYATGY
jgi:hypothetical protein